MCPAAGSFAEALDWTAEVYRAAGALMKSGRQAAGCRRRGRLLACLRIERGSPWTRSCGPIEAAGLRPGKQVVISLDIAASEFGRDGLYNADAG